jgi:hypothetical protein
MFSYYRKLVRTNIKADRLAWLTFINESQRHNLSTSGNIFRNLKNMIKLLPNSNSEKNYHRAAIYCRSICRPFFLCFLTLLVVLKLRLLWAHLFWSFKRSVHLRFWCVKRAISHLLSKKSVDPDEIPYFIIKGCSDIFIPLLRHNFNLSLPTGKFPSLWKQAAVFPIFKKGNRALVVNCGPISILNNFSKIFESIIHDQLSLHFRFKLHPNKHGFLTS